MSGNCCFLSRETALALCFFRANGLRAEVLRAEVLRSDLLVSLNLFVRAKNPQRLLTICAEMINMAP